MTGTSQMPVTVAGRGKGLLRAFNEAGVLIAADVHVASRLAGLGGESDERVLLAVALVVRAVRSGSVCLSANRFRDVTLPETEDGDTVDPDDLPWPDTAQMVAALRRSPLVVGSDGGPLRPLRLVDDGDEVLVYLDRYYGQEETIRRVLGERSDTAPTVDVEVMRRSISDTFSDGAAPDRQRIAAAVAATSWTTVVAGGPGTGKTHTVARILAVLAAHHEQTRPERSPLRVGLAAPTGKAAARLQESVNEQSADLGLPGGWKAMTLHRLLGWKPGNKSRFRHDRHNRLPYDVIVVDETSMVSLTMMSRLLEAVRPDSRLILVGDPDQLTSVDAGAVLADLVARPVTVPETGAVRALVADDLDATDDPTEAALGASERSRLRGGVVRLSRGRRFGGDIADLAVMVREGRADEAIALLTGGSTVVSLHDPDDVDEVRRDVVASANLMTAAAAAGDVSTSLRALEAHRLLCAHREGPYGVGHWAQTAMEWVGTAQSVVLDPRSWYAGQPLLVTANDHETRIYNGDTGVVIATGGGDGALAAAFARGGTPLLLPPSQLSAVQTVYAMTIHRSQGSQYDAVSVVLPAQASSLLTRELLYTAITRARDRVRILGSAETVAAAIERQVLRASGLRREITVD